MKFLFLLTLTTLISTSAYARQDGVMVDENGLTIKLNQPVVVDDNRWNFDKDTYINKLDPKVRITVAADAKGNTKSVELNGLQDENGLYIDGAFIERSGGIFVVSTDACNELETRAIFKKLNECKKFEDEIVQIFTDQYKSEDLINKLADIEGISKIVLRKTLATESEGIIEAYNKQKKNDTTNSNSMAAEMKKVLENKCSILKRYSTKKEIVIDESTKTEKKSNTVK